MFFKSKLIFMDPVSFPQFLAKYITGNPPWMT